MNLLLSIIVRELLQLGPESCNFQLFKLQSLLQTFHLRTELLMQQIGVVLILLG